MINVTVKDVAMDKYMNDKLTQVWVGPLALWFSYETIVAFSLNGNRVVSHNKWGATTGRHLNHIDGGDKANRIPYQEFCQMLATIQVGMEQQ